MANLEVVLTVPTVVPNPPARERFFSPVEAGERVDGIFLPFHHTRSTTNDGEDERYDWGIGDFASARDAIDFASAMRFHILQLLPIIWSAAFHSPYSVLSPQALDPEYLGLPSLLNLLETSGINVAAARQFVHEHRDVIEQLRQAAEIDHEGITRLKLAAMQPAWEAFRQHPQHPLYQAFERFREENQPWLEDDILYFLLKQEFMVKDPDVGWDWRVWSRYEAGLSERDPVVLAQAKQRHRQGILFHSFIQFVLDWQWREFVSYATERQVRLMMDMPFAPADARVWQQPAMVSIGDRESGFQRTEVQGVPGKKETPLGQIWQFTVYDYASPAAIQYLQDVFLSYQQRGVTYLRIDHVLGYYQVFAFRQDVNEEFTLARLGIYDEISAIREQALANGSEEARWDAAAKVRRRVIESLLHPREGAPHLPSDVLRLLFNDDGSLHTEGNMVMVGHRLTAEEFGRRRQHKSLWHLQWQTEDKIFRDQPFWEFLRLTPNRRAEDDGFTLSWLFPADDREPPQPTDSIRVAYYRLGPGEAMLYDFDRMAQAHGMVVILETLGNVTNELLASSQRPGGYPLIPVVWGLEESGRYYPAKFVRNDCATVGVHDSYGTLVAWRLLNWESKLKLLHRFWPEKSAAELEAYTGELQPAVNEMILQMVYAPHSVFKEAFEPARTPAIVVLQLLDIFRLEDEYRLNFPGEQSSWKRRLPPDLWLPELLAAARGQPSSERASAGVAMLRRLQQARSETPVAHTEQADSIVGMKPNIPLGTLQVRQLSADDPAKTAPFLIDVYTSGEPDYVAIIFLNRQGKEFARRPLQKMQGQKGITAGITNWMVSLQPEQEGVYRYRIEVTRRDGSRQSSAMGLLVAVASGRNLNFLSPAYALGDIEEFRDDVSLR
jgi:4-alpha-glucanotransferase